MADSYRRILKGTSVFGGVQLFQVLVNLVRGKFVALFLGPDGMGVASLFTSSSLTLQKLAGLGLPQAIVKQVAPDAGNPAQLAHTLSASRRLITFTAVAGALLCMLGAPLWSRLAFGDTSMTWQFALMGLAVGFSIAATGQLSILQGLGLIKRISQASVAGATAGLAIGVPLYWLWGKTGIVPAMTLLAAAMWLFYTLALRRHGQLPSAPYDPARHKPLMRALVSLGLILMVNDLLVTLVQYLVNIFINRYGDSGAVGLYHSANSLTNQYAGMVFTAMMMDYFPRLSRTVSDNALMRETVNRQLVVTALVIAPAVALLIISAPLAIRLLLTSEFEPVMPLMRWFGLGVLFKALSFPMAYIALAKDNKRVYFWLEGVCCNLLTLTLTCGGYMLFGLPGLGYASVLDNLLCIAIYHTVNRRLYGYSYNRTALGATLGAMAAGTAVFAASLLPGTVLPYAVMGVLTAATATVSLYALWRITIRPKHPRLP